MWSVSVAESLLRGEPVEERVEGGGEARPVVCLDEGVVREEVEPEQHVHAARRVAEQLQQPARDGPDRAVGRDLEGEEVVSAFTRARARVISGGAGRAQAEAALAPSLGETGDRAKLAGDTPPSAGASLAGSLGGLLSPGARHGVKTSRKTSCLTNKS